MVPWNVPQGNVGYAFQEYNVLVMLKFWMQRKVRDDVIFKREEMQVFHDTVQVMKKFAIYR